MGAFSLWQWLVVLAVVLILFARPGKISGIMGDFGKGLKNFKKGMKDENSPEKESLMGKTIHIEDDDFATEKKVRPKTAATRKISKSKTVKKSAKKKSAKKKASKI